jgi:hypothetical protein
MCYQLHYPGTVPRIVPETTHRTEPLTLEVRELSSRFSVNRAVPYCPASLGQAPAPKSGAAPCGFQGAGFAFTSPP